MPPTYGGVPQMPAPQPQPAPTSEYGAPPPTYGAPQVPAPMPAMPYYPPPGSAPAPEPEPSKSASPEGPIRGLYAGARVGVGGPFGGSTFGSYAEGVGVLAEAGYAIIPNFGLDLFLHWNHSSLALPSEVTSATSNSGHVLLYGIEARGILGSGPVTGWASLGLSLGSGSVGISQSDSFTTFHNDANVHFHPMPVIGFGAEVRVVEGLSVGPELRWYITSASSACESVSGSEFVGGSAQQCASGFDKETVPDILFFGVGATYRIDFMR